MVEREKKEIERRKMRVRPRPQPISQGLILLLRRKVKTEASQTSLKSPIGIVIKKVIILPLILN